MLNECGRVCNSFVGCFCVWSVFRVLVGVLVTWGGESYRLEYRASGELRERWSYCHREDEVIRFIGGKPGAGKSLKCALQIVEELRMSDRFIVTNAAIEMQPWVDGKKVARKGLVHSMLDKYKEDFDCERRLVFLRDDEVKHFMRCRPYVDETGAVVKRFLEPSEDGRFHLTACTARREDIRDGLRGVCYVLDEAHEYFSSREWQSTQKYGKEVLSWSSQNRRAGDDAYFLTQVIGNVEKQLRGTSQECIWLVNHRLLSLSVFRQPDVLSYRVFSSTPPSPSETALCKGRLQCDRQWVYGIYNTARGASVSGTSADIGVRAKGLHWSWIVVFIAALSALAIVGNKGIQAAIRQAVGISPSYATNAFSVAAPILQKETNSGRTFAPQAASAVPPAPFAPPPPVVLPSPPPSPWVVASATGERICLLLSDGSRVVGTNWFEGYNGWNVNGRFYSTTPNSTGVNVWAQAPRAYVPAAAQAYVVPPAPRGVSPAFR